MLDQLGNKLGAGMSSVQEMGENLGAKMQTAGQGRSRGADATVGLSWVDGNDRSGGHRETFQLLLADATSSDAWQSFVIDDDFWNLQIDGDVNGLTLFVDVVWRSVSYLGRSRPPLLQFVLYMFISYHIRKRIQPIDTAPLGHHRGQTMQASNNF